MSGYTTKQDAAFTIMDAKRAFPTASPWVSLPAFELGGHSVRAFLHKNTHVYFVAYDVGRLAGGSICNLDRVVATLGPGHVLNTVPVPPLDRSLILVSEAGLVYVLARRLHTVKESAVALNWLVNVAAPAVKAAATDAVEERALEAAREKIWAQA